jgi:hypothetical protein
MMIEKKAQEIKENTSANISKPTIPKKAPILIRYENADLSKDKPSHQLNPVFYEKVKSNDPPKCQTSVPARPKYYKNPLKQNPSKLPKYLTKVKSVIKGDVLYDRQKFYKTQLKKNNSQDYNPIEMATDSPQVQEMGNPKTLMPQDNINEVPTFKSSAEIKPHVKSMMDNVEGLLSSSLVNQFSNEQSNAYIADYKPPMREMEDTSPKEPLTASFNTRERAKRLDNLKVEEEKENRNAGLYGNLTSKKSEPLSSNRTSTHENEAPNSIQDGQESSPQSEVISSSDTERKNEGDIYKSVPNMNNNEYLRKRVESMPVDNEDNEQ